MSLQPVKGPKRAEQSRLMAVKRTEKLSGLLIYQYSYLSDCAFKKSNRLNRQNNNSARDHAFLCISLPSLHDYDGKIPNFTFYGTCKQATAKFCFSF